MADKMTTTTSSISIDKQPVNIRKMSSTPTPTRGEAQIVTRLAESITESYRTVTQKQQKFSDLTNQQHFNRNESSNNIKLLKPILKTPTDEWQEVCSQKNKLKRKKTLSTSLTSVTDSVNQEKRTRIEGMQLNCRGRLLIKENINATTPTTNPALANSPGTTPVPTRADRLVGKPPLPPSTKQTNTESKVTLNPPPRLKRKLEQNVQTIQKLNALTEQLRLELNELKSSLTAEKGAVRVLRAQNESEARKWKNEVKKLQNAVDFLKKAGVNKKCETTNTNNENYLPQAAMGGLVNYEIQRLTNEINNLKEANKALEEKKLINCEADRRKAADIRELKDSYEIRLTQIQKSAKNEISRLLEEIKTKERNIGQLKKDLQILQNSKNTSRNATTQNTNQTNKTTNSNGKNQNNKKPKSSSRNEANKPNEESSKETEASKETATTTKNKDLTKKAQNSDEISKLKNIELINNTKNVTTNLQKSTKILNTQNKKETETEKETETKILENNNQNTITIIHKHLKAQETPDLHARDSTDGQSCCVNMLLKKHTPLLLSTATQTTDDALTSLRHLPRTMTATATATTQTPNITTMTTSIACNELDHFDEQHITQELTQHLENKAIQDAKENHHRHRHHHHHHHHHHNNHHSDSDSALSSAPTSISPQPPANGEEPTDLWQTMRSYAHDVEKLQKEVEFMQKQNEQLKQELNIAREQIIELETNAMKNANNTKIPQLMQRIKYLEDQEHHLQAEANDLREQNELLEFRILELEETNDKWSLQSHPNSTLDTSESMQTNTVTNATKNLWSCPDGLNSNNNTNTNNKNHNKADPFEMLFGNNSHTSIQHDSGIISPQSQHHHDDLIDISNEELCRRLADLLKKSSLEEDERHCLQQVLNLVQQLDALTPRSGPHSLNVISSSDEASSLDLVKSRVSDYSSASSTSASSARSICDNSSVNATTKVINSNSSNLSTPSRIVATVQPYNSTSQLAPHSTPTDSPRKVRCQPWQTNSLSESGVFVESDFYSDISENNVCTQTDFEDGGISNYSTHHHIFQSPNKKVPVQQQNSSNLTDIKRLQYYKERVEILEGKVLIYESSGDAQAKLLAERLQREIQLEKEVNELRDRVEFLESENSSLEEEKCEFEEAENDTRLRLQRLEIELEILSQRNVELEMSREALSAKYKDCHSECIILREDLATSETQIRHLEEDKQKAKENLEFLHNTLPLLLICNTYSTLAQAQVHNHNHNYRVTNVTNQDMGNQSSNLNSTNSSSPRFSAGCDKDFLNMEEPCSCHEMEMQYLKEEIKCLRHQMKELNARHYTAMESADSHWVDLEKEYKDREEHFRAKEMFLKQKIQKLQDCLKEDARSANEKICQLEEAEQGLKTCLVKVSKEYQKLQEDHKLMTAALDRYKEQSEQIKEQQRPLTEALECEKKRNKGLIDELTFMRKLQQETENQAKKEMEQVRDQMFDLRKNFLHIEVTNGELREEVATLEMQIQNMKKDQQENEEKIRCLTDEIRTKDEVCQKLEKRLERSEGYSLADELGDSPSKRKREDIVSLEMATKGLGKALREMEECKANLPTQKQLKTIARDVKKLADTILYGEDSDEENQASKSKSKNITNVNGNVNDGNAENDGGNNLEIVAYSTQEEAAEGRDANALEDGDSCIIEEIEPCLIEIKDTDSDNSECMDANVMENTERTSLLAIKMENTDEDTNIIVGMALIPQINIDENRLPSSSYKKAICEVPSELRKLAQPTKIGGSILNFQDNRKTQQRSYSIKRGKRHSKRRMTRGRVSSLHLKVNRMVSRLFYEHKSDVFQDASEIEVMKESEVLQRNISYGSFHSLREETTENTETTAIICKKIDVSVECEMKTDTRDSSIGTFVEKSDSSIQVNDEIASELYIDSMPQNIRHFLDMLKSSNSNTKFRLNSSLFIMKICQRWKSDLEFRQGLEILETLSQFDTDISNCDSLKSYEDFVCAMNCLHILEDMFKPHKIELLAQIETEINELLMIFHNQKKESEFYCTVYYPVKRKSGLDLTQLLKK